MPGTTPNVPARAPGPSAAALPTGTVTFLFTDVEGSTRLLGAHPDQYRRAVMRHHELLADAVSRAGGVVFETVGDAVYAAFSRPTDAVAAALAGQLALAAEQWGDSPIKVRMGIHLGEVELRDGHYFGAPLYRCARLMATAHGGQTVLSEPTAALVRDTLPHGAALRDLGEHRLKDLRDTERIFQLEHPSLPANFPPLRSAGALPHNLPAQPTIIVGRERELAELLALIPSTRLLSLVGPGGMGKTRLALELAARTLGHEPCPVPDGAWLVDLAALTDPAQVAVSVAAALGIPEEPGQPLQATLIRALGAKRLLLTLDNCEHVIDACARLADAMIRACPAVTLLATSREPLGVPGEVTWTVPPLAAPADDPAGSEAAAYGAVRLFVERARAAAPAFALTESTTPAVVQLCRRLDGMPLAIELAAARVRSMTPAQLLDRLEDQFRLLAGGVRTALPRQQSLQALIDWSYALLSHQEQTLFDRLAVFAGGWTLEAAEEVCTGGDIEAFEVPDLLARLVDRSLVVAEPLADGTMRYRLLETLRAYARQRLSRRADSREVERRHATHYADFAQRAERPLLGHDASRWVDIVDREIENFRTAVRWCAARGCDGDEAALETGFRLVGALFWFFRQRSRFVEAREWTDALLAAPGGRSPARVRALFSGWIGWQLHDPAVADARAREGASLAELLGDKQGLGICLIGLGLSPSVSRADRRALLGRAETVLHEAGAEWERARALLHLAETEEDPATARTRLGEVQKIFTRIGHEHGLGSVHVHLGSIARREGDLARARQEYERAYEVWSRLAYTPFLATPLESLGDIARETGEADRARSYYAEALRIREELGPAAVARRLRGKLELIDGTSSA